MAYVATGRTKQTARRNLGAIPGLVDDDPLAALRAAAGRPSVDPLAALRATASRPGPNQAASLDALRRASQASPDVQAPTYTFGGKGGSGGMSMTVKLLIGAAVLGGAALLLARKK